MKQENSDYLVDGIYGITDLIDVEELRSLFEKFTLATGYTIGFLDHPGLNVLVAAGWRDICTKFHRGCPASAEICIKSNHHLLDGLNEPGKEVIEACDNGLVDCAIPIIVKGKHIASLATGQLLLAPPDIERFRRQAAMYGYDEDAYLAALNEIPIVSRDKLQNVTKFLGGIAQIIAEMGYVNLTIKEKSKTLEREIAGRTRAEKELRESEERMRDLMFNMADWVWEVDENGVYTYSSSKGVELFGHVIGKTPFDFMPADEARRVAALFSEIAAHKAPIKDLENRNITKDGKEIYLRTNGVPILDTKGNLKGYRGVDKDITGRRKAEEELARYAENLKRSNEELQHFAYIASHDLQEPLRMVKSYVQLLAQRYKGKLDADADDFIGFAVEGADRMHQLINDLLAYSRVGSRAKPFAHVEGDAVVAAACANIKMLIEENAALVTSDTLPPVVGDETQLGEKDREWVFSVSDNGIGIAPEFSERIFVIFQRLHMREKYPGSGIGLAICQRIVARHGGKIWYESEPGKGSTFYFTLPKERTS